MRPTPGKIARFLTNGDYRQYVISTQLERYRGERRGIASPPSTVILIVTNDCNLRCQMCALATDHPDFRRLDMPQSLAFKVLDEIRDAKPLVVLCGGEPMIYPYWRSVIERATQYGIRTNITTNGTLLGRAIEEVVDSGLSELSVSLDGVGDLHDSIRGRKGLFDRATRAMREIIALRDSKGLKKPEVRVCFVINEMNYVHMVEYAKFMAQRLPEIGGIAFLHMVFANPLDLELHNRLFWKAFRQRTNDDHRLLMSSQQIDLDRLKAQYKGIAERQWPFEITFSPNHPLEELEDYYHNPRYRRQAIQDCRAPWTQMTISAEGSVTPCLNYVAGDAREANVLKIWNNKRMRRFRRVFAKQGRFPLCHRCCF